MLATLPSVEFDAPQGKVRIEASNNHCVVNSFVGKAKDDGVGYEVVKNFGTIEPVTPYCNL